MVLAAPTPHADTAAMDGDGNGSTRDTAGDRPSFRHRIKSGVAWIFGSSLARHALRVVSSMILTRLLAPDSFGLIATAALLPVAIEMCSDFGVRHAIVHNPNGSTRRYLDVAWTLIAFRGFVVAAVVLAMAAPFAAVCDDERVFALTCVSAITPALFGLCSPGRLRWSREMRQDLLAKLDLYVDVARLPINVACVLLVPSAMGLAIASVAAECVRVPLSYVMAPDRPTWTWDRAIVRELGNFGRFVFASSLLGFLAARLDVFFVARFLGMEQAGIYYIAQALASPVEAMVTQMLGGLLFPMLSRLQHDPDEVRRRMWQALRLMLGVGVPLTAAGILVSPFVVELLYDPRYAPAVPPLQALLVAAYLSCLGTTFTCALLASGRPYWGTLATLARLVAFCGAAYALADRGVTGYALAILAASAAFMLSVAFVPWTRRPPATAG